MSAAEPPSPPGLVKPRRFRPSLAWELVGCASQGHELVGTDARTLAGADPGLAFERDGVRWHRCLRCDSWLPLPPPGAPTTDRVPPRDEIEVPLRGRPLRDRYVLRAIAVDRVLHFLAIGALAAGTLLFVGDRAHLHGEWTRILNRIQGGVGGPLADTHSGLFNDVDHLFTVSRTTLILYGIAFAAYAVVNLVEAIGLWRARRWAEYLTLLEVVALVPYEIYELTKRVSVLKIITLVINLAVVAYLLWAHRLLGVRGGGRADAAERERDSGWAALDRAYPPAADPVVAP